MRAAAPLRILLIDEDASTLRSVSRQLEALGNTVDTAADARDALQRCNKGRVDLAICELMLPGMDGHEFLKGTSLTNGMDVVLMASEPEPQDIITAFRAGCSDFLLKPCSRVMLKDMLSRLHQRRSPHARAAAPAAEAAGEPDEPRPYDQLRTGMFRALNQGELQLPVAPKVLVSLSQLAASHDPDPEAIYALLESEILLGRAVMRLAQTPEFRGRGAPRSVREAIARVGTRRALANAATAAQRANYDFKNKDVQALAARMWLDHFLNSLVAELVSKRLEADNPEAVRTMALFSQVGSLAMLRVAAESFAEHLDGGPSPEFCRLVTESGPKVSAMLLAEWGMPADLIAIARWAPPTPLRSVRPEVQKTLGMIVAGREMAKGLIGDSPFGRAAGLSPEDSRSLPRFSAEVAGEIRREALETARSVLKVRG